MRAFLQQHVYAALAVAIVVSWIGRSLLFYHGLPQ